mgnify:CR=1 FL=1
MKTKEQLIEEVANLTHDNERFILQDQIHRKEFAKAFSWHKKQKSYLGTYNEPPEPILPSWEQIWVNLGTLLAARNFMDYKGNISELECKLENLENKISKEVHPNL